MFEPQRKQIYETALQVSQYAVYCDQRGQTKEALKYYQESIENFLLYIKDERNEVNSLKIRTTIENYIQRAEYLKQKIYCYECYERGILFIHEAINSDKINDYERAYHYYTDGIELILKYLQFENNPKHQTIHKQLESYLDRAETMKRMINPPSIESKENLESKENQNSTNNHDIIQPSAPPISLCVICLSSPAIFAMIPCGHLILCEECLNEYSNTLNTCYLCRTTLIPPKYLKIYTT